MHLHDCSVKAAVAVQRRSPLLVGGELDPIRQDEIEKVVGGLVFSAQLRAVDRVQAVEKIRVGAGAALEIGGQRRLEPVIVGALTFVTRSQRILFPGECLLVCEKLEEGLARDIAVGSSGRRRTFTVVDDRSSSRRGGGVHAGHGWGAGTPCRSGAVAAWISA